MRRTMLVLLPMLALGACVYDLDFFTMAGSGGSTGTGVCAPGATLSCYQGPTETEGVGICKAGTKTCASDGASWGPCMGEVLPEPPDCASGMDLHCDGKVPSCTGKVLWAKRFGDAKDQGAVGVATDALGNVAVTGSFSGAIDFGGGQLQSQSEIDVFVAKLDPGGTHLWSERFGGTDSQSTAGMAIDRDGNLLLAGWFKGAIDFGGGPLASTASLSGFVVKLGPDGSHVWSRGYGLAGSTSSTSVRAVAVDPAGDVFLTGNFSGSVDFGGGPIPAGSNGAIFTVKLDPSGAHVWSKAFQCTGPESAPFSIAAGPSGNVVITGSIGAPVDFGGGPVIGGGAGDAFAVQLDASGGHLWSKAFGDGQVQDGTAVAIGPGGNFVLTGLFSGAVDFGGGPLTSSKASEGFLAKLDPAGGHQWSKQFGDGAPANISQGNGVALDANGNVLVTGSFSGSARFGGNPIAAIDQDVFLTKLDPTGAQVWANRFGATDGSGTGTGVAVDANGNSLLTGSFLGTIDFGIGQPLVSAGFRDVFVAKLSP